MRYINLRLTYLLTYLLTYYQCIQKQLSSRRFHCLPLFGGDMINIVAIRSAARDLTVFPEFEKLGLNGATPSH